MTETSVRCNGDHAAGWTCVVTIRDGGRGRTSHEVRVRPATLARLDPDATDSTPLVTAAFAFLLDHEPPESILRTFDLEMIARYFPDWESAVRRRLNQS